jgi:hypothetical protein
MTATQTLPLPAFVSAAARPTAAAGTNQRAGARMTIPMEIVA